MAAFVLAGQTVSAQDYPVPRLNGDFSVVIDAPADTEIASPSPPRDIPPAAPACVAVREITLTGASVLTQEALLVGLPRNGCFDVEALFAFTEELTNRYVAAGYVTSRAFLPEQDLGSGRLEIMVVEGRVEAVELIEDGRIRPIGHAALPLLVGQVLNIRGVEQGLDQINGLASKDAKISFRPGAEAGWSIVEVAITAAPGWSVKSGIDNQSDTGKGQLQGSISVILEDVFGAFETISFTRRRSLGDADNVDGTDSVDFSVPLGDYTLGWSSKATFYRRLVEGSGQTFETTGDTLRHQAFVERLIHRDQQSKTSLRAALRTEDIRNYLEGTLIGVSSRVLSVGMIELTHNTHILGGSLTARTGLHKGLPLFGAGERGGPLSDFVKFDGQVSYGLALGAGFSFSTSVSGQWSPDELYSSEQLSLGGTSTVRGFNKDALMGENGANLRNELTYALPSLGPTLEGFVGDISAFAALDAGWILPGASNGETISGLSGGAVGLRASNGTFYGSASWEFPLDGPAAFDRSGAFRFDGGLSLSQF